jgi:hypothetical protein
MFVRFKIGRLAGEVHEMKFADAQPLLGDGRAEQVYAEIPKPAPTPEPKNGKAAMKPAPQKSKKR